MFFIDRLGDELFVGEIVFADFAVSIVVHLEVVHISGKNVRIVLNEDIFFGLRQKILRDTALELILGDETCV